MQELSFVLTSDLTKKNFVHLPTINMDFEEKASSEKPTPEDVDRVTGVTEVLNASGHKQELEQNFSLLSLCAIGITTGNVWAALGGSIVSRPRPAASRV